jgi:hypothetical protein
MVVGYLTPILTAANNWALGTTASRAAALSYIDSDLRSGTRDDGTGFQQRGDETFFAKETIVYPRWQTPGVTYSKTIVQYEGGYQGVNPTTFIMNVMGIDTAYINKLYDLIEGYKQSGMFQQAVNDLNVNFLSNSTSGPPAWYRLSSNCPGVTSPSGACICKNTTCVGVWDMYPGDINSTPYQSFNAFQNLDSGL